MGQRISAVGVLDKAVLILGALESGALALSELTDRTGMPRATTHRLAAALEAHGLIDRDGVGRYRLGRRMAELGRAAQTRPHLSLVELAGPVLGRLRDETGESAQLYVRSGDGSTRVCVAAAESPHGLRTIVSVGSVLPMDRGSAAKVLSGETSAIHRGWAESVEERERGVASVSAPVVAAGDVVASVSVSGPVERTTRQPGRRYAAAVVAAAGELSTALGG
ncbi:MAG TPA: IclR family transcriptional regulator [Acidimicrobiales bacterium]|jgi:DNA-binding IclR family transcriptional regulator|nr:IclR family transcriptional regulator [Acidimicrobiales bacterium]